MSTMKIITPKGAIREVDKVVPVVEARFKFNGKVKRFTETAEGLSAKPTALAFHYASNTFNGGFGESELFIGNLSSAQVMEIQQSLVKDGYFDFGRLEFQKDVHIDKTVFDEGASAPYTSEYTFGLISNFTGSLFGGGMCNNMGGLFNPCNNLIPATDVECCEDLDDADGEDDSEDDGKGEI